MKSLINRLILVSLTTLVSFNAFGASYVTTQAEQAAMTPAQALTALKAGNQRFVSGHTRNHDYGTEAEITARKGQFPIAFVLNCVDSRSDAVLVFNQGIGNVFTGALAGNLAGDYMVGSMEFATKVAGSKIIVVMGHTHCGAVAAACAGGAFGHLDGILNSIRPAVKTLQAQDPKGQCNDPDFVNKIAKQNVLNVMQHVLAQSTVIASLKQNGKIAVVGAMHDIATGKVTFFDINGKTI
jgi:carbonic anhydrase